MKKQQLFQDGEDPKLHPIESLIEPGMEILLRNQIKLSEQRNIMNTKL